jgi:hypothetical protein
MDIPIWMILAFLVFLIAFTLILLYNHNNVRLIKWEEKASKLLRECGYDIVTPKVIKYHKTYTVGKYNINGRDNCVKSKSATIFLYIDCDDNTIISALIHQLAHVINPTSSHEDTLYQVTLEKLSMCAALQEGYDPFEFMDRDYPMK